MLFINVKAVCLSANGPEFAQYITIQIEVHLGEQHGDITVQERPDA